MGMEIGRDVGMEAVVRSQAYRNVKRAIKLPCKSLLLHVIVESDQHGPKHTLNPIYALEFSLQLPTTTYTIA